MSSYYGKLSAEVYDIDKYIGRSFGDVEYYSDRLKDISGRILEPAVGNGRILIPLLQQGLQVEGFDFSNDMLELCRRNMRSAGVHTHISRQDMADFTMGQTYTAVIVPAGSFLLLHDRERSISALKCFYEHLETGGKLIFDTFLPTNFTNGFVAKRTIETKTGDLITLDQTLVKTDFIRQVTYTHHTYEKWRHRKCIDKELEMFPLRWYGVEEMVLILKEIGFQNTVISADYTYGNYPDRENQTITFEAIK